jgi:hypothetical protein
VVTDVEYCVHINEWPQSRAHHANIVQDFDSSHFIVNESNSRYSVSLDAFVPSVS